MKKTLVILLCLILTIGLFTSCGGSDNGSGSENMVVYGYPYEPILDWDPSVMYSNGKIVLHNVYETLTRINPETGEEEFVLAESYTVSDDGLIYTYKLREGVTFHDGTPFTAEAVKFSYERTRDMEQGPSYMYAAIDAINIIDDFTVDIVLKYPSPFNLVASANYGAFIMSPSIADKGDDWFVDGNEAGTGPYTVQSQVTGNEVVLAAYPDYWGGWTEGQCEIAVIQKITESSSRTQMVTAGDLDITVQLPYEDIQQLETESAVNIEEQETLQSIWVHINTEADVTSDPLVREALVAAFPYDDAIEFALGFAGAQGLGAIPATMWGNGEGELETQVYDIDKAKDLMIEAGYEGQTIDLTFTYSSGVDSHRKIAEMYKVELAKIGINLEIQALAWDSLAELARSTEPNDRQDLLIMFQEPDYSSPYAFLQTYMATDPNINMNFSYYANAEFDSLINQAEETAGRDLEAASNLFVDAQKIAMEDNPIIFVADSHELWVTNAAKIKSINLNPMYNHTVRFYEVELN